MNYWKTRLLAGIAPAVRALLIANTGLFLTGMIFSGITAIFGLTPSLFWRGAVWQPFTYMFLHGGILHFAFNMLVLWMFGSALEAAWGARRFLVFYIVCGTGAGIIDALVFPSAAIPTIGASGALYGVLMAYAVLWPEQLIYFWGIFPVKAKYFVVGIGILELFASVGPQRSGIAHFVHLSGMLFGLVYLKGGDWISRLRGARRERTRKKHLRVVQGGAEELRRHQEEIDSLLDKLNREGPDSLTPGEREQFRLLADKIKKIESRGK